MRKQSINTIIGICIILITVPTIIRYYVLDQNLRKNHREREIALEVKELQAINRQQTSLKLVTNTNASSSSSKSFQYSSHLETLQWKDFKLDPKVVLENCGTELNMTKWAPAGVTAKICLFPEYRDRFVSKAIKKWGNWEADIQEYLFKHVFNQYPTAVFVDIGGHLGTFSISAAKLGRNVFTFEPIRDTATLLTTSVALNSLQDRIRVYPVALMEKEYDCVDLIPNLSNMGGRQVQVKNNKCTNDASPTAVLDDLLPIFKQLNISEAIIKMDCEASEPRVILGGVKFLKSVHVPIIAMEFSAIKDKIKLQNKEWNEIISKFFQTMKDLNYVATPIGGNLTKNLTNTYHKKWPGDITWVKVANL